MVISALLELAILDVQVANTKGEAIKKSTKKNLLTQLKSYTQFCDRLNLQYFPCDNKQLCRFGQTLASTFQSPEAVSNYLSGVRTLHALLGLTIPDPREKEMQMFTQGLKRIMQHAIRQAAPITPELLIRLSRVVKYTDMVEMVSWVAVLLGFYMFLRKSNLVPVAMDKFNSQEQFTRGDIHLTSPYQAMMTEIRWSKTIQFKQKVLRFPVIPAQNKAICPVFWTYIMINRIPASSTDPALALRFPGKVLALSSNQLILRLRKWLTLIGEDSMAYSLHSLRRGGATFAYRSNIESGDD